MSNWLRNRKNKELAVRLVGVISFLFLAIPTVNQFGDHLAILAIAIALIAGFMLTICVPTILLIRRQERLHVPLVSASTKQSTVPSNWRVYALMALVTLISALYQAYAIDVSAWVLGHSTPAILLSNFSILAAIIGVMELFRRRTHRQ
jgi:hypothetical protein